MENLNNELAKEFTVWCWGKEVSSDVSKIESLFSSFLAEKDLKGRDFEILTFKNRENNLLYTLYNERYKIQNIDGFTDVGDRDLQYCMKYYEIISVKRLSDGAIFNTDDFITNGHPTKIRITEFSVVNKELRVFTDNDYSGWNLLKDLTKFKPVLFTTLDGINIFEGDTYWYLDCVLTTTFKCTKASKDFEPTLPFSTEIAAKNYKKQNQKKYSLKDIKETVKKLGCFGTTLIEYLEKDGN